MDVSKARRALTRHMDRLYNEALKEHRTRAAELADRLFCGLITFQEFQTEMEKSDQEWAKVRKFLSDVKMPYSD